MTRIDQVMYALLGLIIVMAIGMLTGSWRAVLYPYLIVIGLAIFLGLVKDVERCPKKILIPVVVSAIYLILYIAHDIITLNSLTGGNGFIFGLSPAMALYILGIWPMAVLVCLLFSATFSNESFPNEDRPMEQNEMKIEGGKS